MKRLFLSLSVLAILLTSCQKEKDYAIHVKLNPSSVWAPSPKLETNGDPTALMGMYIFNNSGNYVGLNSTSMESAANYSISSSQITTAGHYLLYGFAYLPSQSLLTNEANSPLTTSSYFTLNSPKDVCLGLQEIDVVTSQLNYTTTINIYHIMAQLALTITGVPADITYIDITLPNQANQFNFQGSFVGNSTSQVLGMQRSTSPDADGNYTWTLSETIVYPCATGTTSMPITVMAIDAARSYSFNTASTTCCTPSTRTALSTTWNTLNYYLNGGLSVQPWTTVIQEGSFDLGSPTN